jgi:hypothetical protein
MKIVLLIIISLLSLFNFSFYSINIRTSSGLRIVELAAKGETLISQMCRPMRDLGRWVAYYVRRLRFASPTVNIVLSLRDFSDIQEFCRTLRLLDFLGCSRRNFSFFLPQAKIQPDCNGITVRL